MDNTQKVLVIDDDPSLLQLITYNLEEEGFTVIEAATGKDGIRHFYQSKPDIVILDIMMPELDGYGVCERIREVAETPVIMLTARGQEEDVIKGLELGADDYITKPFRVGELIARIRANLRRVHMEADTQDSLNYSDPYMTIDLEKRRIAIDGNEAKLTPTEYRLLTILVRNKGRILTFRQILESVWGFEYIDDIDYLRVYIWHLRRKLEPDPKNPIYLLNELNTGYRFEPQK